MSRASTVLWLAICLGALACKGPAESVSPTPPVPTPDVPEPTCTEVRGDVAAQILEQLWASATGHVFGSTRAGVIERLPDGTWLPPEGPAPRALSGFDETVWAYDGEQFQRRAPGGPWEPMGGPPYRVDALRIAGPDEVFAAVLQPWDDAPVSTVELHRLEAGAWTTDSLTVTNALGLAGYLPDGRLLATTTDGLQVQDGTGWEVIDASVTGGFGEVGPDGTIAVADWDGSVWIGDSTGLTAHPVGLDIWRFEAFEVLATDDVWLSGEGPTGLFLQHWDGVSWASVDRAVDAPLYGVVGLGGGQVLAGGGEDGLLALIGDRAGLTVDRHEPALLAIETLAVDDVTGTAWAFGGGGRAQWDGTRWVPAPVAGLVLDFLPRVAVSADRMLHFDGGVLQIAEPDGTLGVTTVPDEELLYTLCGTQGRLFALGRLTPDLESGVFEPWGRYDDGDGWVGLDLSGLDFESVTGCWADGPEDVWLGVAAANGTGGLAHWDGTAASQRASLPVAPSWMARQADGDLWLSLSVGPDGTAPSLWTWDGASAAAVAGSPSDVRAAHVLPDGTVYASVVRRVPDDLEMALLRRSDGDWEQVEQAEHVVELVGKGEQLWAGSRTWSYARTCTPGS